MKALRALQTLTAFSSKPSKKSPLNPSFPRRFYAAQPQEDDPSPLNPAFSDTDNASDSVFDSSHFALPSSGSDAKPPQPNWDKKYRAKVDEVIFGKQTQQGKLGINFEEQAEIEEKKRRALAKALLEAALAAEDEDNDDDLVVKEEDQKSLSVGIVGAPNAGKSALTNYMEIDVCKQAVDWVWYV